MTEIIGYVASVLVAVSLTMSSILRLRVINLVGAIVFTIYGLLIGSIPVAAVNTFIVMVNIYYLFRLFRQRELFRVLHVGPDSEYLRYFLEVNRSDIARYMPGFDGRMKEGDFIVFVLRDLVPAGLFIGEPRSDGSLLVTLDYVRPDYRDLKVADFLFRQRAGWFAERGIQRLIAHGETRAHARYLRTMGFAQDVREPTVFTRVLEGR